MPLLAGLALLAGGCHDAEKEAARSAALELATIKADANKACRCEQRGGSGAAKACWAHFETTMARKHASMSMSTCAPVYSEERCWSAAGQDSSTADRGQCITTEYSALLYGDGEALLCTAEEAKAAEAASYEAAGEEIDDTHHTRRFHAKRDAADAAVRSIARGERFVAARANTPGCI